jgi:maltose-binding protein MalE
MTNEEDIETEVIAENSTYNKKYREALKMSVKLDVQELSQVQPDTTAKEVLMAVLKDYDTDIPSPILLEMAQVFQASKKELVLI